MVRGGRELVSGLAERTKALAAALRSPRAPRRARSADRARPDRPSALALCACKPPPRRRVSQSRWYVKQPTWRLWGEERVEGAVYTVYLKKVRYHRPTRTSSSDSEDEISHLEWETVRVRFVKAGTVERLVEALSTDDGELESTYINVFLATYRSFASPERVLELLLQRYRSLADDACAHDDRADQHKKTLVSCLHVWLDSYPEDFRLPPHHPALHHLLVFTQTYLPDSELHNKVLQRLESWSRVSAETSDGAGAGVWDGLRPSPRARAPRHPHYTLHAAPHRHFAEQLTRMDMELFKKVVPHQCLGAVWSRRDKNRRHEAATVLATVNQFNAVSLRVISSALAEPGLRAAERADVLAAWLDIAQELRVLKNFSSLKAIVSGLQSNPVYRLRSAWALLSKEKTELFEELARIFSEDNNRWAQRELLVREGTAKFADTVGENDRQLQKRFQKQIEQRANTSHGTIPYLGTFLTDLTMIDTAIPDRDADGLVNFDKRRKEFEVLAQIKLLQGAANAYHIEPDPAFDAWFDSVPVLDDREAHALSCAIEPERRATVAGAAAGAGAPAHRKNDSIASTESGGSSQFYCDADSKHSSLERHASPRLSSGSSSSSIPSLDASLSSANSKPKNGKRSLPGDGAVPVPTSPAHALNGASAPDFYIIRVTCESAGPETEGVVLYKSIMLSNKERTPQVIHNALLKLNLEGSPDDFTLSQMLPDREMVLPANANVYYAVNTAHNLNFILRPKRPSSPQNKALPNGKHATPKK